MQCSAAKLGGASASGEISGRRGKAHQNEESRGPISGMVSLLHVEQQAAHTDLGESLSLLSRHAIHGTPTNLQVRTYLRILVAHATSYTNPEGQNGNFQSTTS